MTSVEDGAVTGKLLVTSTPSEESSFSAKTDLNQAQLLSFPIAFASFPFVCLRLVREDRREYVRF